MSAGTTKHNVRIDDALWAKAKAKAARENVVLSEVMRSAIEIYAALPERETTTETEHPEASNR